jgi:hypothetical protein
VSYAPAPAFHTLTTVRGAFSDNLVVVPKPPKTVRKAMSAGAKDLETVRKAMSAGAKDLETVRRATSAVKRH